MTTPTPGTAVPAENIEWLEGSTPDLTEREQMLVNHAHAEGYAEGERHGYRIGGQDALRAATELTTIMSSQPWQKSLATLSYFVAPQEPT